MTYRSELKQLFVSIENAKDIFSSNETSLENGTFDDAVISMFEMGWIDISDSIDAVWKSNDEITRPEYHFMEEDDSDEDPEADSVTETIDETTLPSEHSRPSIRERKARVAFEFIKQGPVTGPVVAKIINVENSTFNRHYVPILKQLGVRNDRDGRGYYVEQTTDPE